MGTFHLKLRLLSLYSNAKQKRIVKYKNLLHKKHARFQCDINSLESDIDRCQNFTEMNEYPLECGKTKWIIVATLNLLTAVADHFPSADISGTEHTKVQAIVVFNFFYTFSFQNKYRIIMWVSIYLLPVY